MSLLCIFIKFIATQLIFRMHPLVRRNHPSSTLRNFLEKPRKTENNREKPRMRLLAHVRSLHGITRIFSSNETAYPVSSVQIP